ncbi:VOC family protein [Streptomyces sp. NPDC057837]|uniref:VOC family protein n=1 Tax=unclassified Streptomyces TaxID=2593676 RepID=UPI0036AF8D6B
MFTAITHSQIYVLDQDEALDFYVGKLGLEVTADADLGFMRWLTVSIPGRPDRQILLETPDPPRLSAETAQQVRELLAKGAMGGHLVFSTDDCRTTYATLRGRNVEFTEEPTERPYGIDCGLRDPFGNSIRFTQPKQPPSAPRSTTGNTGHEETA